MNHRTYTDRKDAAEYLANELRAFESQNPIILAIPRGGVEVGYYIAKELKCDFDVLVSRKLGHPLQPEAAFGAIAEDNSLYLDPWSRKMITKEIIEDVIKREKKEVQRRVKEYRKGKALPRIKGRTVILVDDGIATGSTLFAAIEYCEKQKAGKIVVAAPVSSPEMYKKLLDRVNEVVIPETPSGFYAVSQAYEQFSNLTDRKVLQFLEKAEKKNRETQKPVPG